MAAGRDAVRLDEAETAAFLAEQMKVQIATIGPDGAPHLSTLYYVLDDAGRITFWTYGASQKVVNLRRDPRVSALVEAGEGYFDLQGVSIRGTARLVEDYDAIRAVGARVASRMAGGVDLGEAGAQLVAKQAAKRVGVVIEPEHVATWDHRKLSALPGQN